MRGIARKERPHPGAQLRLTDADGHQITCFATNATGEDLPVLELRHRRRARIEDRIRAAKDTGLANLPYADAASNQLWLEFVLLAQDLLAWMQLLALYGEHALAEPKRLRLHLFAVAGRMIRTGRRRILDLDATWPWVTAILRARVDCRSFCRRPAESGATRPDDPSTPRPGNPSPARQPALTLAPVRQLAPAPNARRRPTDPSMITKR